MSLVDWRIKGIPVTFLIVLVAIILVFVFFGAWAVSANSKAPDREFYFGVAGGDPSFATRTFNTSQTTAKSGSSNQENDEGLADEWWGKALLKACPFH